MEAKVHKHSPQWRSLHKDSHVFEAKDFRDNHKPTSKGLLGLSKEYKIGLCIAYKKGETQNHTKKARNSEYFPNVEGSEKYLDYVAGEITQVKNISAIIWSISENKILFDSKAE